MRQSTTLCHAGPHESAEPTHPLQSAVDVEDAQRGVAATHQQSFLSHRLLQLLEERPLQLPRLPRRLHAACVQVSKFARLIPQMALQHLTGEKALSLAQWRRRRRLHEEAQRVRVLYLHAHAAAGRVRLLQSLQQRVVTTSQRTPAVQLRAKSLRDETPLLQRERR